MPAASISRVKTAADLIAALPVAGQSAPPTALGYGLRTGFAELDSLLGGLRAGAVWLVVGEPGAGRSALAAQLAGRWATGWVDRGLGLVSGRDEDRLVAARLVAGAAPAPLGDVLTGVVSERDSVLAYRARADLAQAPLMFGRTESALTAMFDQAEVVIVDDVDLLGPAPLHAARLVRDWVDGTGSAAVLTAPAQLVLRHDRPATPLDHRWASLVDVTIEIRRFDGDHALAGRAGEADLAVIRHRTGPLGVVPVAFQGRLARFADMPGTTPQGQHPLDPRAALPVPMPEDDLDYPWRP